MFPLIVGLVVTLLVLARVSYLPAEIRCVLLRASLLGLFAGTAVYVVSAAAPMM